MRSAFIAGESVATAAINGNAGRLVTKPRGIQRISNSPDNASRHLPRHNPE